MHDASRIRITDIPCLSPFGPWPVVGRVVERWPVVAVVTPDPAVRTVGTADPTCAGTATQAQSQTQAYPSKSEGYARPARSAHEAGRVRERRDSSLDRGRAPVRAARPAAASIAAAGG
jgi:hypothetical protein